MRSDLNKQLCERERIGHRDSYKPFRKLKKFNVSDEDGPVGGREGMKFRYGYDGKRFNENLNPLYGIVRKAVGRRWDKFYSELSATFDKRSVINQHILEHLYQYVEINTFMQDGQVMVRGRYSGPNEPLKGSSTEFYVDPRDGIIKLNKWMRNYKTIQRQRVKEREREQLKVTRFIDDRNVLRLVEGVWFHFTLEELPEGKYVYDRPSGCGPDYLFKLNHYSERHKTWDQLTEYERQRFGAKRFVGKDAYDVFYEQSFYRFGSHASGSYRDTTKRGKEMGILYHATKQTASHKMLKQAGIV